MKSVKGVKVGDVRGPYNSKHKTEDERKEAHKLACKKSYEKRKVVDPLVDENLKLKNELEQLKLENENLRLEVKKLKKDVKIFPKPKVVIEQTPPLIFATRKSKLELEMTEAEIEHKKFIEKCKAAKAHSESKKLDESEEDLAPKKVKSVRNRKSEDEIIYQDDERKQELDEIRKMFEDEEKRKADKKVKAQKIVELVEEDDDDEW